MGRGRDDVCRDEGRKVKGGGVRTGVFLLNVNIFIMKYFRFLLWIIPSLERILPMITGK